MFMRRKYAALASRLDEGTDAVCTPRMAVRHGALAVALVGALAGACTSIVPTTAPATATPAATAAPTPLELFTPTGKLPPGRYVYSGFDQPMTFELDGTWTTTTQSIGYFDLVPDPGPGQLQVGLIDGIETGSDSMAKPTSAVAAAALRAYMGDNVVETREATIGGRTGPELILKRPGEPGGVLSVWALLSISLGTIGLSPGQQLSIVFFETPEGLIAIVTRGMLDNWQAAVDRAKPVIDSIAFGP
jgi:hypothetical protein